jgi:outer membrane protein TolC
LKYRYRGFCSLLLMIQLFVVCLFIACLLVIPEPARAGQMTLDKAFENALSANPTIKAMTQRINQSREKIIQARAAYYPQVSLDGAATRIQPSDNDIAAGFAFQPSQEYYNGSVSAKWVIFSGFSRKHNVQAALLGQDLEEAGHDDVIRNLLSSVAASFHTAQLALANKSIASSNKIFYAKQLEDARIKKEAGKGSLSDVLNFNTRMNQAQIEMEKFTAQYDVARVALAALLGDDVQTNDLPDPVFPETETQKEMTLPDEKALVAYALDNRPDLIQMGLSLEILNADIETAKAKFFPEISLNGSLGVNRTGSGRFETHDLENSVSLQLSYPLFSGGKDRAALQEARLAVAEIEFELKNLKNQIVSQILQNCFSLTAAQKQLRLYRENAKLVKQNRDMVAKEYQYGKTSLVNLNEVQNNLSETQQQIALSLISLRQAWYELKASAGSIEFYP